ncbi:MAG: hypothetical protein N2C14_12825 [Planctomycetales bacterium]
MGNGVARLSGGPRERCARGLGRLTLGGRPAEPLARPMHARRLIEVASFLAQQAPFFSGGTRRLPAPCRESFWRACEDRQRNWTRSLEAFRRRSETEPRDAWEETKSIIEEIFLAEPLSRVWAAVSSRPESGSNGESSLALAERG